jgi:hypothetical protein
VGAEQEEDLHGKNENEFRPQGWGRPQEEFSEEFSQARPFVGIGALQDWRKTQSGQQARRPQDRAKDSGAEDVCAQNLPPRDRIRRAFDADSGTQIEPLRRTARPQIADEPNLRPGEHGRPGWRK